LSRLDEGGMLLRAVRRSLEVIAIIGRGGLGFAGLRLEDLEADPRTLAPR
jgi:hypothetical protein